MQNDGRFSLVTAMSDLVKVSEALEAMADISLDPAKADSILMELAPQLDTAVDNFKERVDARINFLEFLKVLEAKLKDDVAYLTAKANSCASIQGSQDRAHALPCRQRGFNAVAAYPDALLHPRGFADSRAAGQPVERADVYL